MRRTVFLVLALVGFAVLGSSCQTESAPAESAPTTTDMGSSCSVQGVWSLQSVTVDGVAQALPAESRGQIKVITASHYAWASQQGAALPLVSVEDSLAAYRTRASGAGRYRIDGSMYVESLEYFSDPRYIGREVSISCPTERDSWSHAFDWSMIRPGQPDSVVHVVESWRRLE